MTIHICTAVKKECWNPYDSFGEICVHCGCCSVDPITRAKARLEVSMDHLHEKEQFNMWDDDPKWRAIQERNIKTDIKILKRLIRYYSKRIQELERRQANESSVG